MHFAPSQNLPRVNPINRNELAHLFTGEGIELGVAAGNFSLTILKESPCKKLWSIDRWNDHHDVAEYAKASQRLIQRGRNRCIPLRMTFSEALPLFPDESMDFIYIDGNAAKGQENGRTLEDWWPKLKPGGIFSGHDYHPRWAATMSVVNCPSDQIMTTA